MALFVLSEKGSEIVENYQKAEQDYKAGMKYKDIAEKYGTTINTVKSWKKRYAWSREEGAHKIEKGCTQNKKRVQECIEANSWVEIEHEYVTDISRKPCSLEDLAKKYSIPIQTIKDQSATGKWSDKRTEYKLKTNQKLVEKSSDKDAERIARLLKIADIATDKAEQALGELEQYVVRDKKKVRTVEYKDNMAIGKPTKEVVDETETVRTEKGPVDRMGLSQVTSALKNIKELYALPVEMDRNKYQAEYERKRAEVKDNAGEEILQNMQTIADILKNPVANRRIEDFEEKVDE